MLSCALINPLQVKRFAARLTEQYGVRKRAKAFSSEVAPVRVEKTRQAIELPLSTV